MVTPRRLTVRMLATGGLLLAVLVAAGSRGVDAADLELQIDGDRRTLRLPERPYDYATPDLPPHFRTRAVRRADNTPRDNPITDHGATLGRVLFYDTRLSADSSMSCATCHRQDKAFADPRRVSTGIHGDRGRRNAMSLVNARFHARNAFFWDERATTLEAQVLMPIEDPSEMAFELDALIERLEQDPRYVLLFYRAFGDPDITIERVARALAQFVRALVSHRSEFDEGLARTRDIAVEFPNFSRLENEGKAIFFGLHDARSGISCATCHTLGGRDATGQVALFLGREPGNNGLDRETADDEDGGVGEVSGDARDWGRFKVPTLRNIGVTGPYMHDGRLRTLREVVDHYRKGVQPHPNVDRRLNRGVNRRGGRPRPFALTLKQRTALIAFLETLTDRALLEDPRFSDPWR